jgi:hypothetical protein
VRKTQVIKLAVRQSSNETPRANPIIADRTGGCR